MEDTPVTISPTSVGEDFPREQQRVRELLEQYKSIGPAGVFGAVMIEDVLSRAERSMASGDVVAIVQSYAELRACK